MMALTCPGQTIPWSLTSPESSRARVTGGAQLVLGEDIIVLYSLLLSLEDGGGEGGSGGLKSDAQEDHRLFRVLPCYIEAIHSGIDYPHIGALSLGLLQTGVAAGNLQHVAKSCQDHPANFGQRHGLIGIGVGGDTDRAPRPGEHLNSRRQELTNAVLEDGHGMSAAEFHQSGRGLRAPVDAGDQSLGEFRAAKFAGELQAASSMACISSKSRRVSSASS